MLKLSKINPMARAIGTMGAIAALVGGITFAALSSNTVALTNNQLSSATTTLAIADGSVATTGCAGAGNTAPGMNFTGANALTPGQTSPAFPFCIKNTGTIPLNLTVSINQNAFNGDTGIQPGDVTLNITCDSGSSSGTLNQYTGGTPLGAIAAGATDNCNATVQLASTVSTSNASVPAFDISFVGNQ